MTRLSSTCIKVLLLSLLLSICVKAQVQKIATIRIEERHTNFGARIVALEDINLDGYDDFLIEDLYTSRIYFGGDTIDTVPVFSIDSTSVRSNFVCDVNGDSYRDLVIGGRTPWGFKNGVYFGGPIFDTIRDLQLGLDTLFGQIYTVCGGDINHNGTEELICSEYLDQESLLFFEMEGALDSVPDFELFPTTITNPGYGFGRSLTAGDFTGDGTIDIAVSYIAPLDSTGLIYIYTGDSTFDTIPDLLIPRPYEYLDGSRDFSKVLESVGDINADGWDDLFASTGSSGYDTVGFVFFGGPAFDSLPDLAIPRRSVSASPGGDIDNDGYGDFLLSYGTTLNTLGFVAIFLGGPDVDSIPDVILDINDETGYFDHYGLACEGIGDVNGDGIDDFAFSTGRGSGNFEVYVYSGWDSGTDIAIDYSPTVPSGYTLSQNYPNPFNPATTIEFALPEQCHVQLTVTNILGQTVSTLVDKYFSAGSYSVRWSTDDQHRELPSGVYFYTLKTDSGTLSSKMLYIK